MSFHTAVHIACKVAIRVSYAMLPLNFNVLRSYAFLWYQLTQSVVKFYLTDNFDLIITIAQIITIKEICNLIIYVYDHNIDFICLLRNKLMWITKLSKDNRTIVVVSKLWWLRIVSSNSFCLKRCAIILTLVLIV